jgi:hypothetical protein
MASSGIRSGRTEDTIRLPDSERPRTPNKITGANAGGLHLLPFLESWAARIA